MGIQNPRAPESAQFDETTRAATTTGARRHRPSTKTTAESPTARRKRVKHERVEAAASRVASTAKRSATQEDRREAPSEMVTDAKPRNLKSADKDDKKSKGKSTQARATKRALRSPKTRQASRAA